MKKIYLIIIITLALTLISKSALTQPIDTIKTYLVVKNDGNQYVGKLLRQDAREILLETTTLGQIIIPKYEIKEIRELKKEELTLTGDYIPAEVFSTRYFITTNGLPMEKGESYILWNLYGPEFQFGIAKNLGVGIMTTWAGMPFVANMKFSYPLSKKANIGFGLLAGTGSWAYPDYGGVLPFGVLSYGDRKANINFSGGYGAVWLKGINDGRMLTSLAGMIKVGKKISLVFDSFIAPNFDSENNDGFSLIIPGLRLQTESKKAFQFGFAGVYAAGEFAPTPIPVIQWFRML